MVKSRAGIKYDMENNPLEIKTDSEAGSNDQVAVMFKAVRAKLAGSVRLKFTSPAKYMLGKCRDDWTNYPTSFPSNKEKVLRITLTRSEGLRLQLHCNGVEVLNLPISNVTCRFSMWSTYWNRPVTRINFMGSDNASDYYRQGSHGKQESQGKDEQVQGK